MRSLIVLTLGLIIATPATAQVAGFRGPTSIADQHRYETERLRIQSDQRALEVRQQALNARLTQLELQSRRQSTPITSDPVTTSLSLEQARAARQSATARRETTVQGVTQIDGWLDRPRP